MGSTATPSRALEESRAALGAGWAEEADAGVSEGVEDENDAWLAPLLASTEGGAEEKDTRPLPNAIPAASVGGSSAAAATSLAGDRSVGAQGGGKAAAAPASIEDESLVTLSSPMNPEVMRVVDAADATKLDALVDAVMQIAEVGDDAPASVMVRMKVFRIHVPCTSAGGALMVCDNHVLVRNP